MDLLVLIVVYVDVVVIVQVMPLSVFLVILDLSNLKVKRMVALNVSQDISLRHKLKLNVSHVLVVNTVRISKLHFASVVKLVSVLSFLRALVNVLNVLLVSSLLNEVVSNAFRVSQDQLLLKMAPQRKFLTLFIKKFPHYWNIHFSHVLFIINNNFSFL